MGERRWVGKMAVDRVDMEFVFLALVIGLL